MAIVRQRRPNIGDHVLLHSDIEVYSDDQARENAMKEIEKAIELLKTGKQVQITFRDISVTLKKTWFFVKSIDSTFMTFWKLIRNDSLGNKQSLRSVGHHKWDVVHEIKFLKKIHKAWFSFNRTFDAKINLAINVSFLGFRKALLINPSQPSKQHLLNKWLKKLANFFGKGFVLFFYLRFFLIFLMIFVLFP